MPLSREPTMHQALSTLIDAGVRVESIIDIGVLTVTRPLLEVFPDRKHYLFEPVDAHNGKIEHNYRNIPHELHNIALSSQDGEMYLAMTSVDGSGQITHSRLVDHDVTVEENPKLVRCTPVRQARLDAVVAELSIPAPFLIKIDVDGHETEILRGAAAALENAHIVVIEAPLNREGPSKFFERARFLTDRGFVLMDIVDLTYYDGILWQVDLVFVQGPVVKTSERLRPFEGNGFRFVAEKWYALNDEKFRRLDGKGSTTKRMPAASVPTSEGDVTVSKKLPAGILVDARRKARRDGVGILSRRRRLRREPDSEHFRGYPRGVIYLEKARKTFSIPQKRSVIAGARVEVLRGDGTSEVIRNCLVEESREEARQPILGRRSSSGEPVFTVVTPVLNGAEYIDSTIASVVSQEGAFYIHYHVKDGGSTDGTVDKLRKWRDLLSDPAFPLVRCLGVTFSHSTAKDNGLYDAVGKGFRKLQLTPAGICAWINADDVFTGGAFSAVLKIFEANDDCHWVISVVNGCGVNQEELSLQELQYPTEMIREGLCDHVHWPFIQQEGSFWSTHLWRTAGGVDPTFRLAGDWDLWRRFARYTNPVHVMWPLGRFRLHGSQLSGSSMIHYREEIEATVPLNVRGGRLREILSRKLQPVRIVQRGNRRDPAYEYEERALSRPYARATAASSKLLDRYFETFAAEKLRVLTFSTLMNGGAGTGSFRRVQALRRIGVDASLISIRSDKTEPFVSRLIPTLTTVENADQVAVWNYIHRRACGVMVMRDDFLGHDVFSTTETVVDFRQLKSMLDRYDVLHFHWTVGMLDYAHLAEVVGSKPVFWTTGDMNSFTGGCHYSEGCMGFMDECERCPLTPGDQSTSHETWKIKAAAYKDLNITVVCPSEYIASLARKSSLFRGREVAVIPNAYPVDLFSPVDCAEARQEFGLPQNRKLIMFSAHSVSNSRKGSDLLEVVAEQILDSEFGAEVDIMCAGEGKVTMPLPVHHLGNLGERNMARAFSAADVFVSLTREDVGPMTVVESLLCGTPVVGFDVGVLSEVGIDGRTSVRVPVGDVRGIVEGIGRMLIEKYRSPELGALCRDTALRYGDPVACAMRHKKLYEQALERSRA